MDTKTRRPHKGVYEKIPGSGIWWVEFYDAQGKRHRKKVGSKARAIKFHQLNRAATIEGRLLPQLEQKAPILFGELIEDALEHSKAHKSDSAKDEQKASFFKRAWGQTDASSITPKDLNRWLTRTQQERGWSNATVNRYKAFVSLCYRLGIENSKVASNPARAVRRFRENNAVVRFLSGSEEIRLRQAIQEIAPWRISDFDIALDTGMRASEQFGLLWSDVDLERKIVTLRTSKNGDSRHINLTQRAAEAFRRLRAMSLSNEFVFPSREDQALKSARHWFNPALKKANIVGFTWHCLRHTFASRLVMAGVDLRTVMECMGHKTLQMTMRYAHLAPDHKREAFERLERYSENVTATATATDQNVVVQ